MSEIADTARVDLLIADFANTDQTGKMNLIGAGVSITGVDPATGQTIPLAVVLNCAVDPKFVGSEYALELALYGDDGQVVTPPGPIEQPPIRVGRPVQISLPIMPGAYIPQGSVWPAAQVIVNFTSGLPLAAGKSYEWRVSVDGNVVRTASLHVAGPVPLTIG